MILKTNKQKALLQYYYKKKKRKEKKTLYTDGVAWKKMLFALLFMGLRESFVELVEDYIFSKFYFILFS